jgi:hypothetical protein
MEHWVKNFGASLIASASISVGGRTHTFYYHCSHCHTRWADDFPRRVAKEVLCYRCLKETDIKCHEPLCEFCKKFYLFDGATCYCVAERKTLAYKIKLFFM